MSMSPHIFVLTISTVVVIVLLGVALGPCGGYTDHGQTAITKGHESRRGTR